MLPPHMRNRSGLVNGGSSIPTPKETAIIISITLAEAVAAYEPIHINASGLGELASNLNGKECHAVALVSGGIGATIAVAIYGEITTSLAFTVGADIYLGDGILTDDLPTYASNTAYQTIGIAKSQNIIWLNIGIYEIAE
jgi:hypothetical protein